jgi:transposase InsO family protein
VCAYDAEQVIAALIADFERHGAPLVLRLDRIACQRTPEVHQMLTRYEVLPLHGPPRHPYYYGQLERQNREHRAWQEPLGPITHAELCTAAHDMRTALNALWARPTLNWCTAEEAWLQRPTVDIDRAELRVEVNSCTSNLIGSGLEMLSAQRVATEQALIRRGLLTINPEDCARRLRVGQTLKQRGAAQSKESAELFRAKYPDLEEVIEARVPRDVYERSYRVQDIDRVGPGFCVDCADLPLLTLVSK